MDQIQRVPFRQDALGQPIRLRQRPHGRPHVELQVAGALPESQQATHGRDAPVDAGGGLALPCRSARVSAGSGRAPVQARQAATSRA